MKKDATALCGPSIRRRPDRSSPSRRIEPAFHGPCIGWFRRRGLMKIMVLRGCRLGIRALDDYHVCEDKVIRGLLDAGRVFVYEGAILVRILG